MTQTLEIVSEIDTVSPEWDSLGRQLRASPFSMPGWIGAWCQVFGSHRLVVICARRQGRLVGVLPLRRHRGSLLSPTNWHTPQFSPVAEDQAALESLVSEAVSRTRGRLDLSFLDSGDPFLAEAKCAVTSTRAGLETQVIQRSPYLKLEGAWDAHLIEMPARKRSKLRRARKRLESEGELSFTVVDGSSGLEEALSEGFAIEAAGWKGEAGTAILSDPATHRFYELIARWAAEKGWLRLTFLRVDGRAVAFGFGIEDGACHYDLKNGFDPAAAHLSPGIVLAGERIRRAFDLGLDRYEFLGGPDRHKLDWTSSCHERVRLQVFPGTTYGRLQRLARVDGPRRVRAARTALKGVADRALPDQG